MDKRIEAVRNDPCVGTGSCTYTDECYTDDELVEYFDEMEITDPVAAVKHRREMETIQLERACDARCGEENDPEPKMLAEWRKQLAENPL